MCCSFWKVTSADRVLGPKAPSGVACRARCNQAPMNPLEPRRRTTRLYAAYGHCHRRDRRSGPPQGRCCGAGFGAGQRRCRFRCGARALALVPMQSGPNGPGGLVRTPVSQDAGHLVCREDQRHVRSRPRQRPVRVLPRAFCATICAFFCPLTAYTGYAKPERREGWWGKRRTRGVHKSNTGGIPAGPGRR